MLIGFNNEINDLTKVTLFPNSHFFFLLLLLSLSQCSSSSYSCFRLGSGDWVWSCSDCPRMETSEHFELNRKGKDIIHSTTRHQSTEKDMQQKRKREIVYPAQLKRRPFSMIEIPNVTDNKGCTKLWLNVDTFRSIPWKGRKPSRITLAWQKQESIMFALNMLPTKENSGVAFSMCQDNWVLKREIIVWEFYSYFRLIFHPSTWKGPKILIRKYHPKDKDSTKINAG